MDLEIVSIEIYGKYNVYVCVRSSMFSFLLGGGGGGGGWGKVK